MKRLVKYAFVSMFALLLGFSICDRVSAAITSRPELEQDVPVGSGESKSQFWETIGNFIVEENGESFSYAPSGDNSEKINYSFDYQWQVKAETPIIHDGTPIYYFYGINGTSATIDFVDIKGSLFSPINDLFTVYKYNFTSENFESLTTYSENSSGSITLENIGVYRLTTSGTNIGEQNTYFVIEDDSKYASYSVESVGMVVNEDSEISFDIEGYIRDPRKLDNNLCDGETILINSINYEKLNCELNFALIDSNVEGYYLYKISLTPQTGEEFAFNVISMTIPTVYGNIKFINSSEEILALDFKKPIVQDEIKYYNKDLTLASFGKTFDDSILISKNAVAKFTVYDFSDLSKVLANDKECNVSLAQDMSTIVVCEMTELDGANELTYTLVDKYSNTTSVLHENITWDNVLFEEGDSLENIEILENGVKSNFITGDILKICLFYGEELSGIYECAQSTLNSVLYYNGTAILVATDHALNIATKVINIEFNQDFDDSVVERDGNNNDIFSLSEEVGLLVEFLNEYFIVNEAIDRSYLKIGDLEISEESFEYTYVEILNKYLRNSTCAFEACNFDMEVVVEYKLGEVDQMISKKYHFVDEAPYIPELSANSVSKNDVDLEYKSFDVNTDDIKKALNADALEFTLQDTLGNQYLGVIKPALIQYTNKKGEVTNLNNESYTYLKTNEKLGIYLLECRVALLSKNGVEYTEEIYGKSFFIDVNVKDTIKPVLALKGDKEVSIKQYDTYKDAGVECSDADTCTYVVEYYLNNTDSKVEKLDTSVGGKYIIRYVAKDSSGNESIVERMVTIEEINSLDTVTIIIILAVILVFAAFITYGIIREKKKSKIKARGEK